MIELEWIDTFFASIRRYISVRPEDQSLILIPNQVYRLNQSGLELLMRLERGEGIETITRDLGAEAKRDVYYFFCDLRALVRGCVRDGEKRRAIEYIPYQRPFTRLPVLSELALTYRCNLNCRFCYVDPEDTLELRTDQLKILIGKIAHEARVPSLSFTGGEPTLREDLIELVAYAKSLNLWVNLITNGTRLSPDLLSRLKAAGLDSIQISIEASDPKIHDYLTRRSGSFDQTLTGISNALKAGIKVHTNTTINRINQRSLLELPRLLKGLGLDRFSMNLMIPIGRGRKEPNLWLGYHEIRPLIERIKEIATRIGIEFIWYSPTPYCQFNPIQHGLGNKACAACEGLLSVSPRGEILPCSSWPRPVGNLLRENFHKIWWSKEAEKIRSWLHPSCYECEHKEICRGGCPLFWEVIGCELYPSSPDRL